MNKPYKEYFKDPKWQKKRLEIFERDEFKCQRCEKDKETLHVHHRYYTANKKPWEYKNDAFVTLCKACHEEETEYIYGTLNMLSASIKQKFFSSDIERMAESFWKMEIIESSEITSFAICHMLENKEILEYVVKKFFQDKFGDKT